ncbi:MAG: MarR family winged helix-turn-helix transcriptional regulator [Anaerovoracaceae bacterium]
MLDKETYYLKKTKLLMLQIFNMVMKTEEVAIREAADSQNLSVAEMHTLVAVGRRGAKTMTTIAGELRINVSTLSIAINKLEKKGCVKRIRNEEDRRVVRISLTAKGRRALDQHEKFYFDMVEEACGSMDEQGKRIFIQSLENMAEFFERKLDSAEKTE